MSRSSMFVVVSITLIFVGSLLIDARPPYPHPENIKADPADPDKPLFLTPYIMSGQVEKGRELAKVYEFVPSLESYSGFITVENKTGSNIFFWSVATQQNDGKAPLVVWLQGGPGASSLFGLLAENGPLAVDATMNVSRRAIAWTNMYNMVWIDNPVGTGFSFVTDEAGYRVDEDGVGEHLYEFIVQFYALFPHLLNQPLYIAGESYGGKYVPAFGFKVAQMEKFYATQGRSSPVAKLAGILVGNGLSDPESTLKTTGNHLHSLGLLSSSQRDFFNEQADKAVAFIHKKKFRDAFDIFDMLINGDVFPYPSFFKNSSGCEDYFNFLLCNTSPPAMDYYEKWVQLNDVRDKIHVGNLSYGGESKTVEHYLLNDVMDSVKRRVEFLLTETDVRVLYYSGHLDLIVPTVGTDYFLRSLSWPHRDEWQRAERQIWRDDKDESIAYSTTVGQLSFAIIRNAGHMVPFDQPETAFRMVTTFIGKV